MKKFLSILIIFALLLALATTFVACSPKPEESTTTTVTTEPEPPKEDVIEIIDGYIWVNGVNTGIKAEDCPHVWETVTTAPTCSSEGYDTISCQLCGNSAKTNYTSKLQHTYSTTYSVDDAYHWFACTVCGDAKDKSAHTPDANDICTTCEMPTTATPGVVYDVSADGTYAEVIGYEGTATKVKIASEYKGLPVKTIYNKVFENNKTITHVVIPNTVTSIGDSAFQYCSNLSSVVIGDGVTSIGDYAFYYCSNLSSVVIPDSVTSIGSYAFYYCSNLSSVVIGDSVTSIGSYAFQYCSNLNSVVIGDSVTSIGVSAFFYCYNLSSVVIPDGVTNIGSEAFNGCSNLSSVVIGDSVTSIGNCAFSNCHSSLYTEYEYGKYVKSGDNPYAVLIDLNNDNMSTYTIHEDTKIIAYGVFRYCNRLTSITIPNGVTGIGNYAFSDCSNLNNVIIGDSVQIIGDYAFQGCGLTSLILPHGVKSIGKYALCASMEFVVIPNTVEYIDYEAFGYWGTHYDIYFTGTQAEWENVRPTFPSYNTVYYNYVPQ